MGPLALKYNTRQHSNVPTKAARMMVQKFKPMENNVEPML